MWSHAVVALALTITAVDGQVCPFMAEGTPPSQRAVVPSLELYTEAVATLDIPTVFADIIALMTRSQECWPADVFPMSTIGQSYGGLFIRQAWHCAGSWRASDEVGGCSGGHQRFPPESAWEDNTNLDKARALLYPIKLKYGDALSWGDLIIFAGTAAILHGGGPVTEVCAGRVDDPDGSKALPLGPSEEVPDCDLPEACEEPYGAAKVGLIYVNPQGYLGIPDQEHSAVQIRKVFARMEMNDTETVALIGGGHAFGKAHGACPTGPGPDPLEQPTFPWPGTCGATGKGPDTFTSGIEGAWTTDPFRWDNEYFKLLEAYGDDYEKQKGPGGAWTWYAKQTPDLMMMTTDLALYQDPIYRRISTEFANNIESLNVAFSNAWEKLVIRGGQFASTKHCWRPDGRFKAQGL